MEPIATGLIVAGLVLLFFGASLSVYGVALTGLILGGGGGYMVAPTVGPLLGLEGMVATAASVGLLAVVGAVLAYMTLSLAVAGIGFVAAALITQLIINPIFVDGPWFVSWGVTVVAAFIGAWMGMIFTKTTLIGATSFFGATLASQAVTVKTFNKVIDQTTLDPLFFNATEQPLFLGLFALGLLTQFGLFKFGYVTRIVGILPGAGIVTNRNEKSETGAS